MTQIPPSPIRHRTLPVPGQLVDVRRRRYVVLDVTRSALQPSVLWEGVPSLSNATLSRSGPHHIVHLASVEDGGRGEELSVVWEVEPGAQVIEGHAMPSPGSAQGAPFDVPARFDAFLDAVRWGTISSADTHALQAPFRSGIDAQDYQLDPVARALQMPRVSLLIADDVGLGKTIEAGLVIQELLLRHRARNVLVVCPADIQIQWQSEMREKFGLDFRIIDAEGMRQLRRRRGLHVNPWTHYPRLITSMDYLKRERPLQLFREALPGPEESRFPRRFGLLIVDEAHNVAPSGSSHYAVDSQRTRAIRELTPHFEHKLFLSATPHNGYKESFTALLELLDDQRFARAVEPDRDQLSAVLVRRLKSELKSAFDGAPRFATRRLEAIEVHYTDAERQAHHALNDYARLRRDGAGSDAESLATEFVLKLLKKRLFSSPQAFLDTLEKHIRTVEGYRNSGEDERETKQRARPEAGILRRRIEGLDEAFANDSEYEDSLGETVHETSRLFRVPTPRERTLLSDLQRYAESASGAGDTKAEALLSWLRQTLLVKGEWSDRRVIIFTEYRATQKWLLGLLASAGLAAAGRVEAIYGGMDLDARERIKAAFQAHPDDAPVRILLATDAASEGINLQNHCSRLVHYEIPWNPNRMEQRNGRIDRHGQPEKDVRIYHFVGAGFGDQHASERLPGDLEGDLEFLLRAARKVETIREDLGKVGPVIASQVEEAMIGKRRVLDTTRAQDEAAPARHMLKFERDLKKQLASLADQLRQTRDDLHLAPDNIQRAVEVGLDLANQPPLIPVIVPGLDAPAFQMPALTGSWASALVGLEHPHTKRRRPICFDATAAQGRDDVVLAHLNHRLVQLCLGLLRAEIWSLNTSGDADDLGLRRAKINRVTARQLKGARFDTPLVIAHGRLVVFGADNTRLHEEIITTGGSIREKRFARLNVGEVNDALDSQTEKEVSPELGERLSKLWPSLQDPLTKALENRVRERTANLEKNLAERAQQESAHLRAILEELARSIRAELSEAEPDQLALWSDSEQEQLRRNRDALRRRLEAIPGEIERETREIQARFASPKSQLFPVAVTFLVPQNLR